MSDAAVIILAVAAGALMEAMAQSFRRQAVRRKAIRMAAMKMGVDPADRIWKITEEITITDGGEKP